MRLEDFISQGVPKLGTIFMQKNIKSNRFKWFKRIEETLKNCNEIYSSIYQVKSMFSQSIPTCEKA